MQTMTYDELNDLDQPVNVHDGCTLLPFTTVLIPDRREYNETTAHDDVPVSIRYPIKRLLEMEQLMRRSLWTILNQAFIGSLREEEKLTVLLLGVVDQDLMRALVDELTAEERLRVYRTSQLEAARAVGNEVTYNEEGIPVKVAPRKAESYTQANVRDSESARKAHQLATFAQWYELALKGLYKRGVVLPIDELLSLLPIELETYFDAHDERNVYNEQLATYQAWRTADYLAVVLNGKQLPNLAPELKRIAWKAQKGAFSKYAKEEAQKKINQWKRDTAAFEATLQREQQQRQH